MASVALLGNTVSTRRDLLRMAGAAALGAALPGFAGAADQGKKSPSGMQIGIFPHTFRRPSFEAQLQAAKAQGIECVQVGMNSAGLAFMPDEKVPDEALDKLRRTSQACSVPIVAVFGTFNMCHPDPKEREIGLRRLGVMAQACPRLGVSLIHICTGTRNTKNMWAGHPDNQTPEAWRDMSECVRKATEIARQSNVVLGFEPEVSNVVDSAKKSRQLMDEIGSPHLKVAIDGANLYHKGELARMSEVLDRSFELIGKDIVMAHAKDVARDGDAGDLPAGHGKLDYDRYLSLLHKYGFRGPIFLHSLSEAQVPGCVKFLREKLAKVGT